MFKKAGDMAQIFMLTFLAFANGYYGSKDSFTSKTSPTQITLLESNDQASINYGPASTTVSNSERVSQNDAVSRLNIHKPRLIAGIGVTILVAAGGLILLRRYGDKGVKAPEKLQGDKNEVPSRDASIGEAILHEDEPLKHEGEAERHEDNEVLHEDMTLSHQDKILSEEKVLSYDSEALPPEGETVPVEEKQLSRLGARPSEIEKMEPQGVTIIDFDDNAIEHPESVLEEASAFMQQINKRIKSFMTKHFDSLFSNTAPEGDKLSNIEKSWQEHIQFDRYFNIVNSIMRHKNPLDEDTRNTYRRAWTLIENSWREHMTPDEAKQSEKTLRWFPFMNSNKLSVEEIGFDIYDEGEAGKFRHLANGLSLDIGDWVKAVENSATGYLQFNEAADEDERALENLCFHESLKAKELLQLGNDDAHPLNALSKFLSQSVDRNNSNKKINDRIDELAIRCMVYGTKNQFMEEQLGTMSILSSSQDMQDTFNKIGDIYMQPFVARKTPKDIDEMEKVRDGFHRLLRFHGRLASSLWRLLEIHRKEIEKQDGSVHDIRQRLDDANKEFGKYCAFQAAQSLSLAGSINFKVHFCDSHSSLEDRAIAVDDLASGVKRGRKFLDCVLNFVNFMRTPNMRKLMQPRRDQKNAALILSLENLCMGIYGLCFRHHKRDSEASIIGLLVDAVKVGPGLEPADLYEDLKTVHKAMKDILSLPRKKSTNSGKSMNKLFPCFPCKA